VAVTAHDGFDVRSLAVTYRDGHVLDAHRHRWAQLVYARSGVMQVAADGRVWFVPSTRAIWIPPGVMHEIVMRGEVAMRTLYIDADRAGGARELAALEVTPLLGELIVHIVSIGMLDPTRAEHDRLAGVLMDLIGSARALDLVLPLPRDVRARKLAQLLRADPADKRDLETLAASCGASLRTLQRCFADETGMTIEAWRQKMRLAHAAAALAQGASVTGAALDCGYESPSAFIAAFRRQFGTTPGTLRNA
jgi:AraC-like DNA-binding protein/mannose-6-phosphate isomerase-like protein (cupin superfamily)